MTVAALPIGTSANMLCAPVAETWMFLAHTKGLAEKESEDISIYSSNKIVESLCFHRSLIRLKLKGFLLIKE